MLGAIAGDVIGSVYENLRTKRKDFELFTPLSIFTDDSVLTVAVADAVLSGAQYGPTIKSYARRHPLRGYGPKFLIWMATPGFKPYNSFGNGSAMRVSPVAYAFSSEQAVLDEARKTAEFEEFLRTQPESNPMLALALQYLGLQGQMSGTGQQTQRGTGYGGKASWMGS